MNTEKKTYSYRDTELTGYRSMNTRRYLKRERNHARRRNNIVAILSDIECDDYFDTPTLASMRQNFALRNDSNYELVADNVLVDTTTIGNFADKFYHACNDVFDTEWNRCRWSIDNAISKWFANHGASYEYLEAKTLLCIYIMNRVAVHFPSLWSKAHDYLASPEAWVA